MLPEQRRFLGIVLLAVGVVSLLMTGVVISMISTARHDASHRFAETEQSCKKRLAALGGTVTESPMRLVWTKENLEEGPARLGEASVASVLCPGWKMRTACMGSECADHNAMRLVLEPVAAASDS